VLAFETDLLEYGDIFDGSKVIEAKTAELVDAAQAELDDVLALGGAFEAIDELKGRLVRSHAERMRRIESGDQMVIGVNKFTETAESPLGGDDNILKVDPAVQAAAIAELAEWRPTATRTRSTPRSTSCAGGPHRREHHAGRPSPWPTPAAPPASGPAACVRCSASTAPPRAWPPRGSGGGRRPARTWPID
jgi:methylmalonyl-CoA mutase N-terminal domain/subunit